MQETWVQSLGQEDHLEKRMASSSAHLESMKLMMGQLSKEKTSNTLR